MSLSGPLHVLDVLLGLQLLNCGLLVAQLALEYLELHPLGLTDDDRSALFLPRSSSEPISAILSLVINGFLLPLDGLSVSLSLSWQPSETYLTLLFTL